MEVNIDDPKDLELRGFNPWYLSHPFDDADCDPGGVAVPAKPRASHAEGPSNDRLAKRGGPVVVAQSQTCFNLSDFVQQIVLTYPNLRLPYHIWLKRRNLEKVSVGKVIVFNLMEQVLPHHSPTLDFS